MKLKSLLFVSCLGLLSSVYAADRVLPTYADGSKSVMKATDSKASYARFCEIEIVNESDWDVLASARVTNGAIFNSFLVRAFGPARIMDLYDYRYDECPEGAYVYLRNAETGYQFHSDFHYSGETIRIINNSVNSMPNLKTLTTKK